MTAQEFLDSIPENDSRALVCQNSVGVLWSRQYWRSGACVMALTTAHGCNHQPQEIADPLADIRRTMDLIAEVRRDHW